MSTASEGNLFKSHFPSCQYINAKGDPLTFIPHKSGGSYYVTQNPADIAELTEAAKHPTTRIFIDPNEPMALTQEAVQDAFKRKIIEDFLATQNLNPENSTYTTTNETGIIASSSLEIAGTSVGEVAPASKTAPAIVKVK